MNPRQTPKKSPKTEEDAPSVRASISFPPEIYRVLEGIATEKKVSLAWVVRDAAEQYITGRSTQFRKAAP